MGKVNIDTERYPRPS